MNKHNKPIKLIVEFTDEVVDFADFVKRVLEHKEERERKEAESKQKPLSE